MSAPKIDPAATRDEPARAGHRYAWQAESRNEWSTDAAQGKRCRMVDADGHCPHAAVAALKRSHRTVNNRFGFRWWAYCEAHLYGRVVHDGTVWRVVLTPAGEGETR